MLPLKWRRCCDAPVLLSPEIAVRFLSSSCGGIGARLTPSANSVGTMPMTNG